jgi:UDP-glucose:(heptosyl)LPS alpha-1,3-glucosyltransferase
MSEEISRRSGAPLTIAIGIHHLAPRGGLEDNCIRVAEELEQRGHRVTLFVADGPGEQSLVTTVLALSPLALTNHGRALAFARAFRARTQGRFDRTVAFQPIPGVDVLYLADTLRDRPGAGLLKRLTPRFRTFATLERGVFGAGSASRIIGLAQPQMRGFAERYPQSRTRIAIVPPTLPESRRRPELHTPERRAAFRSELGISTDSIVWLWLGLQPRVKGLDRVVEALAKRPDVHLLVGGLASGDRKAVASFRAARKLGVAERVHWLGYVSDERLFSAMAASDLLAHPARTDVTGGVILEALINGLPVVATELCGFSTHIAASGAGRLVPDPFDQAVFESAMDAVMAADLSELSRRGIDYGADPALYSGIAVACDLIEAESWPPRYDV